MYHKMEYHLIAKDIFLVGKNEKYWSNLTQIIIGNDNYLWLHKKYPTLSPKIWHKSSSVYGQYITIVRNCKKMGRKKILAFLPGRPSYQNVPYVTALEKKMFIIEIQDHKAKFFLKMWHSDMSGNRFGPFGNTFFSKMCSLKDG